MARTFKPRGKRVLQSMSLQKRCGQSIYLKTVSAAATAGTPYQAEQQMSFDGARSLLPSNMEVKPATAVELWQFRLRPTSNKQMTTILTTFIVVSGLLTTSTYPATYTSAIPRDQTGGKLLTQANLYAWFRLVNGISFLLSVTTIFGSALLILELQRHASAKDGARPDMFRREFAQRCFFVYTPL